MPTKEPSRRKRKSPTVSVVADALAGGAPQQETPVHEGRGSVERKAPPLSVDFPTEGELVFPGHYAVRVQALDAASVEIAVDGGGWNACREALGYHWFDWNPSEPGSHEIVARAQVGGRWKKSKARACIVSP